MSNIPETPVRFGMLRRASLLSILFSVLIFSGCDAGFQEMGATEYGVRFLMLPPPLGGISGSLVEQGETVFVWPWERVYRFNTAVRTLQWGERGQGTNFSKSDFVQTRALDGNEVALAVTVEYRVTNDRELLPKLAHFVAQDDSTVDELVQAIGRADIRTAMNQLRTADFRSSDKKRDGQREIEKLMRHRLDPWGVEILSVNVKDPPRFERLLPDGKVDRTYQEKIDEEKVLDEETKREEQRILTVQKEKEVKLNEAQGYVNRLVEEGQGFLEQAKLRGDSYFAARSNEAKAIRARGEAEVKGIVEKVNALSGPGGKAILKLEIVKELLRNDPRFVVLNSAGNGQSIDVNKLDTNALLKQLGVLTSLNERSQGESDPIRGTVPTKGSVPNTNGGAEKEGSNKSSQDRSRRDRSTDDRPNRTGNEELLPKIDLPPAH